MQRQHDTETTEQRASGDAKRDSPREAVVMSRPDGENFMKNQTSSLCAAALRAVEADDGLRHIVTSRVARVRIPLLLVLIHLSLGLVGRLIGLLEGPGFAAGEGLRVLLAGVVADAGQAGRLLLPAAVVLLLLPGRWYRSFGFWMLIGIASFASITLSVGFAVERARGAVSQSVSELLDGATSAGSLWLDHPVTAALLIASLTAVLLLGPVRRAAKSSIETAPGRDG